MNCAICHRAAPPDIEATIRGGWIPSYYCGRDQQDGPVCPECCQKRLRLGKDGEWETIPAPADAHRWN